MLRAMESYADARRLVARLAALDPHPQSSEGQRLITIIATMHAYETRVVELSVAETTSRTARADWRVIEAQGDE